MRLVLVLVAVFMVSGPAAARAAEPTADELIARGLELRRQSRPGEALELFQRAHALAPSARTLGQLGLVEASVEHWLEAETHLNASLATPADAWVRKNRGFLIQALHVSRAHIGELDITGPDGTKVAVDGHPVGTLPDVEHVRLAEGNAVVTATGAGFKDFSKTVAVTARAKVSLAIVLDPLQSRAAVAVAAPAPLPAPPPPPIVPIIDVVDEPARSWKTQVGAGLVAAGVGLAAWGIVWIAVDGHDHCATTGPSCNTVYDTNASGWILAAGGAVAAGAGAVLLILGHRADDSIMAFDVTPTSFSFRGRF
jgi:hypothetical protein